MVDDTLTDLLWELLEELSGQSVSSTSVTGTPPTGVAYGKPDSDSTVFAFTGSIPAALYLCNIGSQQWPRLLRVKGSSLVH